MDVDESDLDVSQQKKFASPVGALFNRNSSDSEFQETTAISHRHQCRQHLAPLSFCWCDRHLSFCCTIGASGPLAPTSSMQKWISWSHMTLCADAIRQGRYRQSNRSLAQTATPLGSPKTDPYVRDILDHFGIYYLCVASLDQWHSITVQMQMLKCRTSRLRWCRWMHALWGEIQWMSNLIFEIQSSCTSSLPLQKVRS